MNDPIPPCVKCGLPHVTFHGHQACTGHKDLEDGTLLPCKNAPVTGSRVCRFHGAARGTGARAKADQRVREAAAVAAVRKALDNPNATPVTDPINELMRLGGRVRDALDVIGARVNDLDQSIRYAASGAGTEQLRAEVAVWERLIGQFRGLLVDMAKLNLDERAQRLSEQQAAIVTGVIQAILDGLYQHLLAAGMTAGVLEQAWAAAVADVVPRELRAAALGQEN